ncbi:MAG: mucoidy inhibitor MuiA family protein [Cytophagales bacterium]|nr:mucoidy inhibitor MuiA family protein [Cytophagales bacterium]
MMLSSTVSSVTVFSDRAAVTRTATVELEAGEHTLIFDNLPPSIEQKSIQVNGIGKAVLGNVKFQTAYEEMPETDKKKLLDDKQQLEDRRQDLEDDIRRLEKEKNFLDNISVKITTPTEESESTELDAGKWQQILSFYSEKLSVIDKSLRKIERDKRELNDQINKLNWELQRLGGQHRKTKNQVAVVLEMTVSGSLTLNLTYIVFNASWTPVYDFRVSSENKQMNIAYNALISQNTGENWDETELKLSTARPQVSGYQPELSPWRLAIHVPKPVVPAGGGLYESAVASAPARNMFTKKRADLFREGGDNMSQMFEADEAEEPVMETPASVAEAGATAVFFGIAGKHSVKTDGTEHKVSILMQDFSAHFRYSAVPKLSQFAYLKARVTNETEFPFLAGEANVFLDNNFVATTHLQTVAPTEQFWTYLGIDEGFKVEHKFLKKYEKKETQLFSKNRKVLMYEYLIRIKNHKKTTEEIVVWDQLPISGNEQIKVQLVEPVFKENSDTIKKNELEYLEWFFKPKSGEEILIPFKFSVEFPQDVIVDGLI